MYLILFTTRVLLGALSFIAGVNKLLIGIVKSRKAMADFGVPKWFVAPRAKSGCDLNGRQRIL